MSTRTYNVQLQSRDGRRYVNVPGAVYPNIATATKMAKGISNINRHNTCRVIRKSDGKVFGKMINGRTVRVGRTVNG